MRLLLIRTQDDGHQTLGRLLAFTGNDLKWACATLEPAWLNNMRQVSCIPTGTYRLRHRTSATHKDHLHVLTVPARDYILIHAGNFRRSTAGCILVGAGHRDIDGDGLLDVVDSKRTLEALLRQLPRDAEHTLTVVDL